MSELSFPELDIDTDVEVLDPAPKPAPEQPGALALLRERNLSELSAVDKGIADLRAEHGSTSYDITTAHGYKLATARRHAVRLVRYQVPKIVSARKAELKALTGELEGEADRIVNALKAIEDPHHALIEAEDKRREAAKAEAKRLDDERIAGHQSGIQRIRSYVQACQEPDMTAERIAKGIANLEAFKVIPDRWQEFAVPAANAQCETLETMRTLHAQAVGREAEAARQEAIRIENERVAAELSEARRQLEEQAAAVRRQQEKLDADRAEAARLAAEQEAREQEQTRQTAADADRAHQSALADALTTAEAATKPAALDPIRPDDPDAAPAPTLEEMGGERQDPASYDDDAPMAPMAAEPAVEAFTLSSINAALGFVLTEHFITQLGIDPERYDAKKPIYTAIQRDAIKALLIAHVQGAL